MKKPTSWCMVLFTVLLLGFFDLARPSALWDEFLRDPNENAFATLESTVAASHEPCSSSIKPSEKQEYLLFDLIRRGNSPAFRAALDVSKCFGAADSEDFYQSTGAFFVMRPLVFLQTVKEKAIQDRELEYLLTMLPLDLVVDRDMDVRISLVEKRIAILNSINDPSVSKVKERGLRFLNEEKEQLENIKRNQGATHSLK